MSRIRLGSAASIADAVLFEMSDGTGDTTVLLDGFQWTCDGCIPGDAVTPCGLVE